jgi:hypothetical protein
VGSPASDEITGAGYAQGGFNCWRRSCTHAGEEKYEGRRRRGRESSFLEELGVGFAGGREVTENGGEGRRPSSAGEREKEGGRKNGGRKKQGKKRGGGLCAGLLGPHVTAPPPPPHRVMCGTVPRYLMVTWHYATSLILI